MRTDQGPTEFQGRCIEIARAIATETGVTEAKSFSRIVGKRESYYRALFVRNGQRVEVFVYADEVGFMVGSEWRAFEKPDFRSQGELLKAFAKGLRGVFGEKPGGP